MTCCARCRRGTRAFGDLPCGMNRQCPCHKNERHMCRTPGCGRVFATKSARDACEDYHSLDEDTDGSYWGD